MESGVVYILIFEDILIKVFGYGGCLCGYDCVSCTMDCLIIFGVIKLGECFFFIVHITIAPPLSAGLMTYSWLVQLYCERTIECMLNGLCYRCNI